MDSKINKALADWRDGGVHSLSWFASYGINAKLLHHHQKNGLLKALGSGIYARRKDQLDWKSGVQTLQYELNLPVHLSGLTALEIHGFRQYVPFGKHPVYLMSKKLYKLPAWLSNEEWSVEFNIKKSNFIESNFGIDEVEINKYKLKVSCLERSILELIKQTNLSHSFEEVENYLEGLKTLRSEVVQTLLEKCRSNKVKRIFLYLSERMTLPYFNKLNLERIDIGSGKRVVVKRGTLDTKYMITVPKREQENPF